ncbi:hypothetical protein DYB37_000915 [Aphanomyces astaci]|uniref:Uncharacterized protein n=1 Tax=Aphanomyces astaci TaxID=112090 RepID=A0A3R6XWI9_APHAT|nr:hypothetical protein DYB35_000531 [Aphanomyces astaci]RHZ13824.1 hypothetical protein DYB37_000915 [Aphanomyces astaci]
MLCRGGKALPHAAKIIRQLQQKQVPHIFLTNGGGCREEKKTHTLSQILDLPLRHEQMILSHTPMRDLAKTFGSTSTSSAQHYGFNKVVSVQDIARQSPSQYPFVKWDPTPFPDEPIDAIVVLHDPIHWAQDLQIAVDVLVGGTPLGSGHKQGRQTPLFVSNDDFTFSGEYPVPRFAQGPFSSDFTALETTRANNAGDHWTSVLVRTGIFTDVDNHQQHPADVVVDGVDDAVEWILAQEASFSMG